MRGKNLLASGALLLGVLALPSAWAIDPATLANAGTGTIAACASCHGKDGGGQASFPRLAGMNATYLLKQLGDFDSSANFSPGRSGSGAGAGPVCAAGTGISA